MSRIRGKRGARHCRPIGAVAGFRQDLPEAVAAQVVKGVFNSEWIIFLTDELEIPVEGFDEPKCP
jgi:hypothetical protein